MCVSVCEAQITFVWCTYDSCMAWTNCYEVVFTMPLSSHPHPFLCENINVSFMLISFTIFFSFFLLFFVRARERSFCCTLCCRNTQVKAALNCSFLASFHSFRNSWKYCSLSLCVCLFCMQNSKRKRDRQNSSLAEDNENAEIAFCANAIWEGFFPVDCLLPGLFLFSVFMIIAAFVCLLCISACSFLSLKCLTLIKIRLSCFAWNGTYTQALNTQRQSQTEY